MRLMAHISKGVEFLKRCLIMQNAVNAPCTSFRISSLRGKYQRKEKFSSWHAKIGWVKAMRLTNIDGNE